MVQCAIIGCTNRSDKKKKCGRNKVIFSAFQPLFMTMLTITTEWHRAWLKDVFRADLVGNKLGNVE